jgi:hypothetical protein
MVTSMLTGTSTILGLFQAIVVSSQIRRTIAAADDTLGQVGKALNLFAQLGSSIG